MSEYLTSYDSSKLFKQPSEIPLACTAYSLLNALHICGAEISSTDSSQLISQVEETLVPLSYEDCQSFTQEQGYNMEWLGYDENNTNTYELLVENFAEELRLGPIIFSISTYLSKRDRNIEPKITIHANPDLQDKEIVHSIVATRDDENVMLIDSFDTNNPEIFTLTSQNDRLELASWLVSELLQQHPVDKDQIVTKESLLQRARSILPERDGNSHFFISAWIYAKFIRVNKLRTQN